MTMTESELKDGRVVAIAGPVIDVEFPRGSLPELNHALEFTVTIDGKPTSRSSPRWPSRWVTAACGPSA